MKVIVHYKQYGEDYTEEIQRDTFNSILNRIGSMEFNGKHIVGIQLMDGTHAGIFLHRRMPPQYMIKR